VSQQNVKLDLVIYNDNREIADIFDPKASDYDLVFKDVMIHPYLTLKKRVFSRSYMDNQGLKFTSTMVM